MADELMRLSLRRELSPDEALRVETFLSAHPELRDAWEDDAAVGRALDSLRDVPVSSNFTARVLAEVDAEERRTERERSSGKRFARWRQILRPRFGWSVGAVAAALLLGYQYREAHRENETRRMANDVKLVSESLARLPDPKILQDFDAINQLRYVSAVSDDELLMALQTP